MVVKVEPSPRCHCQVWPVTPPSPSTTVAVTAVPTLITVGMNVTLPSSSTSVTLTVTETVSVAPGPSVTLSVNVWLELASKSSAPLVAIWPVVALTVNGAVPRLSSEYLSAVASSESVSVAVIVPTVLPDAVFSAVLSVSDAFVNAGAVLLRAPTLLVEVACAVLPAPSSSV